MGALSCYEQRQKVSNAGENKLANIRAASEERTAASH
jgi:hypothetical protein